MRYWDIVTLAAVAVVLIAGPIRALLALRRARHLLDYLGSGPLTPPPSSR